MRVSGQTYEAAAARLTEEHGGFDRYGLANAIGTDSKRCGAWIRRNARGPGCLRRIAAASYGRGADPATYAVVELVLRRHRLEDARREGEVLEAA